MISGEGVKQLDKLLAALPGDGARLPPPDRRLLVQADPGGHLLTRVYDRANLPDRLREILRLAGCHVQEWVPQFTADSRIDSCGFDFGGFLAWSPDRQQILYVLANRPLQFWDPATHELLAEIRALPIMGSNRGGIAYSPDGSKAAIVGDYSEGFCLETKTWKVLKKFHEPRTDGGYYTPRWPVFTADGRHLLLQYDHELAIFDTATWQRVDQLPDVPPAALQFIPAPDHKRAVVTLKSGAIALWDVPRQRSVATLAQNVRLSQVSFSPDGSRLATVTDGTNDFSETAHSLRLRIWKSRNGRLATEPGLDGQTAWPDTFEHLLWSPDGKYLLAVAHVAGGSGGIDIFNVKTGRYRGFFSGPMSEMNGLILLPDGSQLVAGGNDGKIHFWDFNAAINITKSF
jgi:WD40 repeat protein